MKNYSTAIANAIYKEVISSPEDSVAVLARIKSFLQSKNLDQYYANILTKLEKKITLKKNFETAVIESPFELPAETIRTIITAYAQASQGHTMYENKKLLAGFTITYRGTIFDGSAKTLLRKITLT